MGTKMDSAEVIIILSDDEDCEEDISCSDLSVLIVEDVKKSDGAVPSGALDEDLVITFSRRAEVLPHARYDCPIHAFTAVDCEIGAPVADNQLTCEQCFCYICDKLASSCKMWNYSGVCHCNSHKRSDFWNNLRNSSLLGGLKTFNLTLSEIDSHLRHADTMLQSFRQGISVTFLSILKAKASEECGSYQRSNVFDYSTVYEFVSSFLNKADQQDGRAGAIMKLGAAEAFIRHFQVSGYFISQSCIANDVDARLVLLQRVIASMQRQMVMTDLTAEFLQKLQDFYKRLLFPAELKSLKNSLSVRPWDDVLLVSVLKGQNVSGVRKDKGKKDQLIEQISVVLLRMEVLQRQHRYRELCRYLQVVKTDDSKLTLQQAQDLVPFFMCMNGSLTGGLNGLFLSVNAPVSRLSPHLFLFYLRVFRTATAPKLTVSQPAQLAFSDAVWQTIKDAAPLPRAVLVRFALRVQRCCAAVFNDAQCWTSLLKVVNTSTAVPEPSPQFLHEAKDVVNSILLGQQGSNIQIPRFFQEVYPDQALLLLVTGALGVRILSAALSPALPVLNTFKVNSWALGWLWDNLSSCPERLRSFLREMSQEMASAAEGDHLSPFLRAIESTPSSSTENFDQQPSGC
ncbi:uncharacterized protein zgc:112980 [Clinocottus analis]|uniref:uncharacterized protein zgc:112980 n=1 Tax=Clinocottus analis TaxID=304258 RepID=UPI0035C04AB6